MPDTIIKFEGAFKFLSNFHPAEVELDGMRFPTVEHAYQAAKTVDMVDRQRIACCGTAAAAKRMGRRVELRGNWPRVQKRTMQLLLRKKFKPGSDLAEALLATGDMELIEGNFWHDNFWGVCLCEECGARRRRGEAEPGKNHLGKLLMQIREDLRK